MNSEARKQLKETLAALEQLHAREARLLRTLSRESLDEVTDEKLRLHEQLVSLVTPGALDAEDRATLDRLRHAALNNQILLHHARDAARTILQNASGAPVPTAGRSLRPHAVQGGLRVDWRG